MTGLFWVLAAGGGIGFHPVWLLLIVLVVLAVLLAMAWYRIVPANFAHVVVRRGITRVYSPHLEIRQR